MLVLVLIAFILFLNTPVVRSSTALQDSKFNDNNDYVLQEIQALSRQLKNAVKNQNYAAVAEEEDGGGGNGEAADAAYYNNENSYYGYYGYDYGYGYGYDYGYGGESVDLGYYYYYGDANNYNNIQTFQGQYGGNNARDESGYETMADEAYYIIIKDSHVIIIIASVGLGLVICGSIIYYLIKRNYMQWLADAPITAQRYSRLSTKDDDGDDVEMNNASVVSGMRGAGDDVRRRKGMHSHSHSHSSHSKSPDNRNTPTTPTLHSDDSKDDN